MHRELAVQQKMCPDLANSITNIRQQATENVDSSKHLMEEMNRFQKI